MLTNKAHSPQYALWLLPFFCLIRLRWGWWVAYLAIDAVHVRRAVPLVLRDRPGNQYGMAYEALIIGVWGRAVMLVLLFVVMLRSDTALASADERAESQGVPAAA